MKRNSLRYPISRKFGKQGYTLYESHNHKFQTQKKYFENRQIPYKIFPKKNLLKISNFETMVKSIITNANPDQKLQRVEVMISQNSTFSNKTLISKVIPLNEFLSYKGILNLYIAQFALYQKLSIKNFYSVEKSNSQRLKKLLRKQSFSSLKLLLKNFEIPKYLLDNLEQLERVNIWAGHKKTKSSLHFDFYKNYLFVLKGRKIVYLFPGDSKIIQNETSKKYTFHQGKILNKNSLKKNSKRLFSGLI